MVLTSSIGRSKASDPREGGCCGSWHNLERRHRGGRTKSLNLHTVFNCETDQQSRPPTPPLFLSLRESTVQMSPISESSPSRDIRLRISSSVTVSHIIKSSTKSIRRRQKLPIHQSWNVTIRLLILRFQVSAVNRYKALSMCLLLRAHQNSEGLCEIPEPDAVVICNRLRFFRSEAPIPHGAILYHKA